MENSNFFNAFIISIVYLLFKFIEMRFIIKKNKPLKELVREALLVYLSILAGHFIIEQIIPLKSALQVPKVFTDSPDF
tara:strand:+ start:1198 stop:1431 length:234 start_codon:yes stop_codon:yes gene_type:complete